MPIILNNFDGMLRPLGSPQITISPPNMVPTGSLNIPRFDEFDERIKEERYHIRNPTYVPSKYEPIKIEPLKIEPIKIKSYEPLPSFELFPKKNFWDKI